MYIYMRSPFSSSQSTMLRGHSGFAAAYGQVMHDDKGVAWPTAPRAALLTVHGASLQVIIM